VEHCACNEGAIGDGVSSCSISPAKLDAVDHLKGYPNGKPLTLLVPAFVGASAMPELRNGMHPTIWAPERAFCNGSHTQQGYPEILKLFESSDAAARLRADVLDHYSGFIRFAQRQANKEGIVVLTVATDSYRRPLMNWLHSVAASGISSYVVVALDEELHNFLISINVPSYLGAIEIKRAASLFGLKWPQDRLKAVWALRYLLLRALLVSGVTVLQCDVDAIMLRNPIPTLVATTGDVVGQRGTFPFRINLSWGSTLCFGVIMYRPTVATLGWFDLALPRFYEIGDDQSEFQRALDACSLVVWNHGQTWPATVKLHRSLKPKSVQPTKIDYGVTLQPITTAGTRLNVTLLPTNLFPRKCGEGFGNPEKGKDCLIAHCISPKGSGTNKIKSNEKHGFAFLKPGWDLMVPEAGEATSEYLKRIGTGEHPGLK
jgi:hypothetical protein